MSTINTTILEQPKAVSVVFDLDAACSGTLSSHFKVVDTDGHQVRDNNAFSHAILALQQGDPQKVLELSSADLNHLNDQGQTIAHWLSITGRLDTLVTLRDKGLACDITDQAGRTPAHWAAVTSQLKVIQYFHEHGLLLNTRDQLGATPLNLLSLHDLTQLRTMVQQPLQEEPFNNNRSIASCNDCFSIRCNIAECCANICQSNIFGSCSTIWSRSTTTRGGVSLNVFEDRATRE